MTGLIGRKLGMTQVPTEGGEVVAVTVVEAGPCYVLAQKVEKKDGYNAIKLGFGEVKVKKLKKPILGELKKVLGEKETYPALKIAEIRVKDPESYEVGSTIDVSIFEEGERIAVTGISKGKGFQSVIKRWGFSGGPKSHGSKFHRRPGSIGHHTDPGRIWKGKKMAGHTGMKRVTIRGLKVVKVIPEKNLVLIKGAIPGHAGSIVLLKKIEMGVEKS